MAGADKNASLSRWWIDIARVQKYHEELSRRYFLPVFEHCSRRSVCGRGSFVRPGVYLFLLKPYWNHIGILDTKAWILFFRIQFATYNHMKNNFFIMRGVAYEKWYHESMKAFTGALLWGRVLTNAPWLLLSCFPLRLRSRQFLCASRLWQMERGFLTDGEQQETEKELTFTEGELPTSPCHCPISLSIHRL